MTSPIERFKGKNPQGKPVGPNKRCSTCKEVKVLETDFHYCASRRDKRQNSCKPCATNNMRVQRKNPQTFSVIEHKRRVETGVAKV